MGYVCGQLHLSVGKRFFSSSNRFFMNDLVKVITAVLKTICLNANQHSKKDIIHLEKKTMRNMYITKIFRGYLGDQRTLVREAVPHLIRDAYTYMARVGNRTVWICLQPGWLLVRTEHILHHVHDLTECGVGSNGIEDEGHGVFGPLTGNAQSV